MLALYSPVKIKMEKNNYSDGVNGEMRKCCWRLMRKLLFKPNLEGLRSGLWPKVLDKDIPNVL